ncbi:MULTISPECIES: thiamine pyrophosphate-binding protein [Rhodococcus]|uniref:acetolactate synthase n=1 Tax=Rhodococcus opacus RKJ300 = JCM 13270 TaxID=1165867 RepID=I0W678_RHOOP|nr:MULTISPECIES: thiamine pyrophosphate-binding protein [Rhodococcus]EID71894.1 acetolactate synthase [Rhodococcus opacus RKJ300 = JCM 13270]QQZ14764.1 thiamine pyrophosphate-binding protein [Rhodococcus sp. 21391]
MKTYQLAARALSEFGVGTVFGLMGDANLAYLGDFAENRDGEFVAAVAEGGAVSMADGYARTTGRVGVASVSHGPAVTNCTTALVEAVRSRSAVLLLTGSTPNVRDHFQDFDLEGFARLTGAEYRRVRKAAAVGADIAEALARVAATRTPLVLDLPYDLLEVTVTGELPHAVPSPPVAGAPDPELVDDALAALLGSTRPLILAGRGAVESGAREDILRLARAIDAPVMTTLLAKDLFAGEPDNLGVHGSLSHAVAIEEIGRVDCMLVVGAALSSFTTDNTALLAGKFVIQIDDRSSAFGRFAPVSLPIPGDAAGVVHALCERLAEADAPAPSGRRVAQLAEALRELEHKGYRSISGGGTVDMRDAMARLAELLPPGAQVVTDIGRFSTAAWKYLPVEPSRFTVPGAFGSIGLGVATAVGAAAGRRDVPTVCVAGDGGTMMGLTEVSTAVRHRLPLVLVVLDDNCYGAEYLKLANLDLKPAHSEVEWPGFAETARALGARAVTIREVDDFAQVAALVKNGDYPLVVEVKADPARRRPEVAAAVGHAS